MCKKKKVLFVNESLDCAGGEKSLIALLNHLDYKQYEVDLQLFRYGGDLEPFLPKEVRVLGALPYTKYAGASWISNIKDLLRLKNGSFFISKLLYSLQLRLKKRNNPEIAALYWETIKHNFKASSLVYDVAIAYAQGVPTLFVVDKVTADRKMSWFNVNVIYNKTNLLYHKFYYKKVDSIVAVSQSTNEYLTALFPDFRSKVFTINDVVDYKSIIKMSDAKNNVYPNKSDFVILTVARLNKEQKGYDITLEACKILKERGYLFHWYALGEGPYREEMELYIEKNNLKDCFTLLGVDSNPYPYFKEANLYVQTSRHEGFGLSIAEARLLNVPVVTTKFDAVFMQMISGKNGLVVEQNAWQVAMAIEQLLLDKVLYQEIKSYLAHEQKEDLSSVDKFNQLMQ